MNKFFRLFFISFFVSSMLFSCAKVEETEVKEPTSESAESVEGKEASEIKEGDKQDLKIEDIKEKEEELPPPTAKEIGYAYGVILAKAVKMNHLKIDAGAVYKGLVDNVDLANEDINMTSQEAVLTRAFSEAKKVYAAENKAKADAFLADNKAREGVITLDSGSQYEIIEKGDEGSKKPSKGSTVKVAYEGKFLDGKVFDSSSEEGTELSLERVIEGWKELIPLMNIGSKIKAYIPAEQGYGEQGIKYQGQEIIPPNALLIFEIKLIDVVEPETKPEDVSIDATK